MVSISGATRTVLIDESAASRLHDTSARVSRTKTLDGGVVIQHSGFSDGDRTMLVRGRVTAAAAEILRAIHEDDSTALLSCTAGVFAGVIERLKVDNGELDLRFLAKEKRNE